MGMAIDESLEWLISRKEHYEMDDNCQELAKALDTAIETMKKYQKIQEIVNSKTTRLSYEEGFRQIKEVVEDGRN